MAIDRYMQPLEASSSFFFKVGELQGYQDSMRLQRRQKTSCIKRI